MVGELLFHDRGCLGGRFNVEVSADVVQNTFWGVAARSLCTAAATDEDADDRDGHNQGKDGARDDDGEFEEGIVLVLFVLDRHGAGGERGCVGLVTQVAGHKGGVAGEVPDVHRDETGRRVDRDDVGARKSTPFARLRVEEERSGCGGQRLVERQLQDGGGVELETLWPEHDDWGASIAELNHGVVVLGGSRRLARISSRSGEL
mmetsp:Transcript_110032/g.164657  ORF Transcript_110032/g.164657 Transcript_110032/m.164657 type:complete len:204 (+) Transcript_110032:197-808(+)